MCASSQNMQRLTVKGRGGAKYTKKEKEAETPEKQIRGMRRSAGKVCVQLVRGVYNADAETRARQCFRSGDKPVAFLRKDRQ